MLRVPRPHELRSSATYGVAIVATTASVFRQTLSHRGGRNPGAPQRIRADPVSTAFWSPCADNLTVKIDDE